MTGPGFVVLEIYSLTFFSPRDEENLFSWLGSVPAVEEIKGVGDSIYLSVATTLGDSDLSELISIFTRYGIDMAQLSVFDDGRFPWLRRKGMFWYEPIFG
ncbi:hypothetical protein EDF77_0122 [Stenotrophomonas maltophilia]|uniref:hypothetical protein n=1 Tax=Stenotrophomonas chelatiphaga TaxID=517011 RepID=UPI000F9B0D91|nr:hypothetical protein [Stenotrophomonas chelatiphaga]MCS4231629.1 hypothetical protein [Stenotrophomonas chelatiphaga]ROQ48586.1 hypothetical protein EDF77_0122 [Stenotrophomonas maltophilia]